MADRHDTDHHARRKALAEEQLKLPRAKREIAYRERQLEAALLQSCLCLYPLEPLHAYWCPAEAMRLSALEVERRYG